MLAARVLGAASVANRAALTAASVADTSVLTTPGAVAAASLCLSAANATQGQSEVVASNVVLSISSLSAISASVPASAKATQSVPFVTLLAPALGAVSSSLLGVLTLSGSSSIKVSSPNVVVSVATVTVPAGNTSLTIENAVVPVSALPSSGTLFSVHYTTTFDLPAGLADTSGVTRLAFSDASGPLSVQNLAEPITFELPYVPLASDSAAKAQFWDESLLPPAYSSAGCVTMPNAAPPGISISWNPNATDLNLAWQLTGDDVERCGTLLLDCNDPDDKVQFVSLRPELAIGDPAVSCAPGQTDILRILYGHNCTLWRVNETGCYWNATQQRFRGDACTISSVTRMAAVHLTDFMAGPKPVIQMATASQLSLSVDDLKRLRLLVAVVCILFGIMHVGAFGLSHWDTASQRHAMRRLLSAECGCVDVGGMPVWRLKQQPLSDIASVVQGSAVTVAGILGIPFIRLAVAMPEHMLGVASLQAAMGRVSGLSAAKARTSSAPTTMPSLEVSAAALPRAEQLLEVTAADCEDAPPDVNEMASTALCHALQLAYCFGDCEEVAAQQVAYMARLRGAGMDTQRYGHLFTAFKELMIGVGLRGKSNWFSAARLWRTVLTANEGGFWDADSGIAVALLATTRPASRPTLRGLQLVMSLLQGAASSAASVFLGTASSSSASQQLFEGRRSVALSGRSSGSAAVQSAAKDCPLTFTAEAIESSIPPELVAQLGDGSAATRVWTTALVAALLPHLPATWCVEETDPPGQHRRTLGDRARAWLLKQLNGNDELLSSVLSQASMQLAYWDDAHDGLVTLSRVAHIATTEHHSLLMQRCRGAVVHSLLTQHTTVGLFTSEELVGSRRWQSFMVVVSAVIAILMSSIWLYYSRAKTCCLIVRAELGCSAEVSQPCRGFTDSCADLALMYYRFAAAAIAQEMHGASGLQCSAFPNEGSLRDEFLAGLIAAAVALPISAVIATCISLSLATDPAQLRGRTALKQWSLLQRVLLGRAPLEHAPGLWHRLKLRMAGTWCASWSQSAVVLFADTCSAALRRLCRGPPPAPRAVDATRALAACDAATPEEERLRLEDALAEEADTFTRLTAAYRRAALFVLYAVWGIFVWIIFVSSAHQPGYHHAPCRCC